MEAYYYYHYRRRCHRTQVMRPTTKSLFILAGRVIGLTEYGLTILSKGQRQLNITG